MALTPTPAPDSVEYWTTLAIAGLNSIGFLPYLAFGLIITAGIEIWSRLTDR